MVRCPRSRHGFTAVELLVTLAVIGVIVAIAYPAYTDFVERSRRSEAAEALQNLATLQEQFYNDNKSYTDDLDALGLPATTENAYYTLSVTLGAPVDGTVQSYILNANALPPQTADTECTLIRLDSDGTKTPAACW